MRANGGTAAPRPSWRAAQAWPPREPAGRGGKERPKPSGSLPWDTSCSALGPRRSPHLSGSLPRPPAEVCAGGDIRHPRPGRARAPRPATPRSARARASAPGRGASWGRRATAARPPHGLARGTRAEAGTEAGASEARRRPRPRAGGRAAGAEDRVRREGSRWCALPWEGRSGGSCLRRSPLQIPARASGRLEGPILEPRLKAGIGRREWRKKTAAHREPLRCRIPV